MTAKMATPKPIKAPKWRKCLYARAKPAFKSEPYHEKESRITKRLIFGPGQYDEVIRGLAIVKQITSTRRFKFTQVEQKSSLTYLLNN